MLEVADLNVRYGKSHVVFDLRLDLRAGEVVALLGRNGAGKTTTILAILGLLPGASGRVLLDGTDVSGWPAHRRARAGIAYVPAGARCFPNLTVAENLDVAARRNGGAPASRDAVYDRFPGLRELSASLAARLSGGERQMLAIGRALMSRPRVLLLDEPTEGLAPVIVQSLGTLIGSLRSAGAAILLAEQNHWMALGVAGRAALMEKGRIVEELPAEQARGSEALHRILGI